MAADPPLTSIASAGLSAQINSLGAELHTLRDGDGRDLLWNGDPAVWGGRAPILFPIIGMLVGGQYRWRGKHYVLPKHGLARHRRFEVVDADASSATFRLQWNDETFALYPFYFQLDLSFSLQGAVLQIAATARNLDPAEPMLASFGFHPAFRWPLPYDKARSQHRLEFEQAETAPIRRIDANGLVRPRLYPTPVEGRDLILTDELFVDDAMIFDQIKSRKLKYGAPQGPQLEIAFPQMPWLGVWTKPGGGYICIEPWSGVADPEGFDGDLGAKPGMIAIPPAQALQFKMSIRLLV